MEWTLSYHFEVVYAILIHGLVLIHWGILIHWAISGTQSHSAENICVSPLLSHWGSSPCFNTWGCLKIYRYLNTSGYFGHIVSHCRKAWGWTLFQYIEAVNSTLKRGSVLIHWGTLILWAISAPSLALSKSSVLTLSYYFEVVYPILIHGRILIYWGILILCDISVAYSHNSEKHGLYPILPHWSSSRYPNTWGPPQAPHLISDSLIILPLTFLVFQLPTYPNTFESFHQNLRTIRFQCSIFVEIEYFAWSNVKLQLNPRLSIRYYKDWNHFYFAPRKLMLNRIKTTRRRFLWITWCCSLFRKTSWLM